jgi:hypothetical protein
MLVIDSKMHYNNGIKVIKMLKKILISIAIGLGVIIVGAVVSVCILTQPIFKPLSIDVLSYTDNSSSGNFAAQDDTSVYYFGRENNSSGIFQLNKVTGVKKFFATKSEINSIAVSSKYIFYQKASSFNGVFYVMESHMIDKASGVDTKLDSHSTGESLDIVDDKLLVRDKIADMPGSISNSPDVKANMENLLTLYKDSEQTERYQIGSVSADIIGFRYSCSDSGFGDNPNTLSIDDFYPVDQKTGSPIRLSLTYDDFPIMYHDGSLYFLETLHRNLDHDNIIWISNISNNTKQQIIELPENGEGQDTVYSYEYYKQDGVTAILLGHLGKSEMTTVTPENLLGDMALGFNCDTGKYTVLINTSAKQNILYCDSSKAIYWDNGSIKQKDLKTNDEKVLYNFPKINLRHKLIVQPCGGYLFFYTSLDKSPITSKSIDLQLVKYLKID